MSSYTLQFLLKFGEKPFMKRLLNEGMIFAKPIIEFKKDHPHLRFDKNEGLRKLEHIEPKTILELKAKAEDSWKRLNVTHGEAKWWNDATKMHNYSLVAITAKEAKQERRYIIHDDIKTFGEYYILIQNVREFINRLVKTLERDNIKHKYGIVEYYDSNKNQNNLTFFHKEKKHENEKEFRLLIESSTISPTELFIGSIEDIASFHHIDELKGFIFKWEDDSKPDDRILESQ